MLGLLDAIDRSVYSATTAPEIVAEVNAITAGRVAASLTEGHRTLTAVEAGKDIFLSVYNTDTSRILGLADLSLA